MNRKDMSDAHLVRWKPKHEALISKYVQKYMDILRVSDGQVKTSETVKLDVYRRILSHYLEIEGVTDLETKMGLLFRAAFLRHKKYKKQDIYTFRRALAAELRKKLDSPIQSYSILLPLQIVNDDHEDDISLQIPGSKIRLTSWEKILKETDLGSTLEKPSIKIRELKDELYAVFSPAVVVVEGRDEYEAYAKGLAVSDYFRSILNLLSSAGRYSIHSGQPHPIAKYLSSPIQIVFDGEGQESLLYIESRPRYNLRKNTINKDVLERAEKFSNELTGFEDKNSTKELLVDAIGRYGNALETTEWPIAFLSLWQVLELISLSEPGAQHTTKRIKTLLTRREHRKDLLDVLLTSRNDLVHRGNFPGGAGHLEVQMLKLIVDEAIFSLWEKRESLPTVSSLLDYYIQGSLANFAIAERIRTLEFIRLSRET